MPWTIVIEGFLLWCRKGLPPLVHVNCRKLKVIINDSTSCWRIAYCFNSLLTRRVKNVRLISSGLAYHYTSCKNWCLNLYTAQSSMLRLPSNKSPWPYTIVSLTSVTSSFKEAPLFSSGLLSFSAHLLSWSSVLHPHSILLQGSQGVYTEAILGLMQLVFAALLLSSTGRLDSSCHSCTRIVRSQLLQAWILTPFFKARQLLTFGEKGDYPKKADKS